MKKIALVDFRQLPEALRLAVATSAVEQLTTGSTESEVAGMFGTTPLTIHRWRDQFNAGGIAFKARGRHTDKPHSVKHKAPSILDYRVLPEAVRNAGRKFAIAKVKAGATVSAVAEAFGTNDICVSRWMENGETPKKRGRPARTEAKVAKVLKKRGRPRKVVAEV